MVIVCVSKVSCRTGGAMRMWSGLADSIKSIASFDGVGGVVPWLSVSNYFSAYSFTNFKVLFLLKITKRNFLHCSAQSLRVWVLSVSICTPAFFCVLLFNSYYFCCF